MVLEKCLPNTLRRLIIFEDSEDYLAEYFRGDSPCHIEPVRKATPFVGAALAQASLALESLSASFIVDAKDFFEACQPTWTWNNLTSLALTSRLLASTQNGAEIYKLLEDASAAALHMPKLHILEIWTGGKAQACAFRYRATSDFAIIEWQGPWLLSTANVLDPWRKVAERYSRDNLYLEDSVRSSTYVASHNQAIRELQLVQQVAHPLSLFHMLLEGNAHILRQY